MTECFIKAFGETTYTRIDLESGVQIPITYNILDVRKPEENSSHWSKSFRVPGTKTNNQLFQHIFEIGIDGGFNPNKKADVYFLQDTLEVLRGVLQLRKINRTDTLDLIYYEVVAFGGNDDLFTKIADKKLTDLDFSAYDHTYNYTSITNSWTAATGSGYVYPMIDYKGHAPGDPNWSVEDFFPALYAKEYVDKIFAYAGKTYTSDFLNSAFFKNLIIPYNKGDFKFSNADLVAREFRAELSTDYDIELQNTGSGPEVVLFDNTSTGLNYDPSGLYNSGNGKWTVPAGQDGKYTIMAQADLSILFTDPSGTLTITNPMDAFVTLLISVNGVAVASDAGRFTQISGTPRAITDGTVTLLKPNATPKIDLLLAAGDEVIITFNIRLGNVAPPLSGYISGSNPKIYGRVSANAYFQNILLPEIVEGAALPMQDCIPENVQMRDFLLSLINMFRLYVEEDKDNPNNYIIEPRDDYYTSEIVDWSDKLDYEKGLEITPMAELQGRRYIFKYKEDKDYWNNDYQEKFKIDGKSETYGQKIVDVDNDFVTNDVTVETIFSPTPMRGYDFLTRVIPVMYGGDLAEPKQVETNIRILYWNGLKVGTTWNLANQAQFLYPYAGHVDDPFSATLDLSFDCPREVQWTTQRRSSLTDNTLYNKYHKRAIEEITDSGARLVSGWFRLKPTDIFQLSFRKLYYFEKELYRLNKIIDYDLDEEKLTECEFIKALDPGPYVPAGPRFVVGGKDDTIGSGGTILPPKPPDPHPFDNYHNTQENVVTGFNNNVPLSSHGVVIVGDDNTVGGSCSNISIIGSGNFIYGGIENVTLIQCSGLTIEKDNQLWVNNCLVSDCPATQETIDDTFDGRSGTATLVDSTVNIPNALVTTSSVIIVTPIDVFTGMITVTANPGSFDIDSSIVGESGDVNYFIAKY